MDNHSTVNYEVPDRCPKCGRKLNQDEAVTLEPDPLEQGKAKAWHPECYAKGELNMAERGGYGFRSW
jgi:hypothetical protein